MKEKKGKIFNSQEVQAIIAGKKTMFREVIMPQPNSNINPVYLKEIEAWQWATKESQRTPKFQVGQEIFVKEAFVDVVVGAVFGYRYYTGKQILYKDYDVKWKSPVHMKQEHSRITLKIKSVKVERLRDINEKEAFKSGYFTIPNRDAGESYVSKFKQLWNSTQKKQEHKWEANPWVFAYEFEIINFKK